ncbi:MAG: hypothetical protein GY854_29885 [Deltaproteobacteria bacterium]|nr:hypothetical protein [Deltaproteobacteria bacterium]
MGNGSLKTDENQTDARRLLGRGGRILGLAALAHAQGRRPGSEPWHVLSADTVAAAEEVLIALEKEMDPALLEAVVRAAMGEKPATAAPSWAEPFWRDPQALSRIGAAVDSKCLAPAFGPRLPEPSDREKGLAALAVALCRSVDGLRALAEHLSEEERELVLRMTYLAGVTVEPGEPSRMRADMRRILKEEPERG